MPDIRFETSADGDKVTLNIYGLDQAAVEEDELLRQFQRTEYHRYYLNSESLQKACKIFKKLQHEQRQAQKQAEAEQQDNASLLTVSLIVAERREAHAELEVSDDKMLCHLLVETAFGANNPSLDDLKQLLAEKGVCKGIKDNILQIIVSRMENMPSGSRIREIVAEGKPAGQTKQAVLNYLVEPVQDRLMQPKLRDDGTVDMYDFGEIHLVQPGEILMERTPPVVGAPGYDVYGETVYAAKPVDRQFTAGEGTELNPTNRNILIAARKGVAIRTEDGMMVADAYCVNDVDLKTGNITFDGTVMVQGSVKEGLSIKATGDVFVRDYVESATIEAGKNLVIGKGVLGRQSDQKDSQDGGPGYTAKLHCGGDFHANYAQYADIEAGGTLTVAKHLMHCHAVASTIQVVSPKRTEGKILGGVICPSQKLDCNVLGAPSYIPTRVDFSHRFAAELAELSQIREELGERINVVRGMREALRQISEKGADAREQVIKIENTIEHFENLVGVLKQRRVSLMDAIRSIMEILEIDVQKNLFPGVSIRFVDKEIPIKEEKGLCRIKAKDDTIAFFTLR